MGRGQSTKGEFSPQRQGIEETLLLYNIARNMMVGHYLTICDIDVTAL